MQDMDRLLVNLSGYYGLPLDSRMRDADPIGPEHADMALSGLFHHRGYTIAGGTSEVDEVSLGNGFLVGGPGSTKPGFALYVFDNDINDNGSSCNGGCASVWPPVLVPLHRW